VEYDDFKNFCALAFNDCKDGKRPLCQAFPSELCAEDGYIYRQYQMGGGGTGGGGGAGITWPDPDGGDGGDSCNACNRLNFIEDLLRIHIIKLDRLEEHVYNGVGGGGGGDVDLEPIFGRFNDVLIAIDNVSGYIGHLEGSIGNVSSDIGGLNNHINQKFGEQYGRLMDAFMPQFGSLTGSLYEIIDNVDAGFSDMSLNFINLNSKTNQIISMLDDMALEIPQSLLLSVENIETNMITLEDLEDFSLTLPDEFYSNVETIASKVFSLEELKLVLDDFSLDLPETFYNTVENIEAKMFILENIELKLQLINQTLTNLFMDSFLLDKLNEIIKAIEDVSIDITEEAGTNLWDFLVEYLSTVFDLFQYILDTAIKLIIPEDSQFLNAALTNLSDSLKQKFSPMEDIKYQLTNSLVVAPKEFSDVEMTLPIYGHVTFFDVTFLKTAIPKARSFLAGVMIIITMIWAYRKISTDLIR